MANVIRYCKLEESHYGPNVFDVSRPSIFGNPYTHIKDRTTKAQIKVKTREEAIDRYKEWFELMLERNEEFKKAWDDMYEAYKIYDTIYIACFCHLNESCHGDFIAKRLKQRSMKEMIDKIKAERNAQINKN